MASEAPTAAASSPPAHIASIDGYRAIAALLVVLHHLPEVLPGERPSWLAVLASNGWMGVDLFFVLSGFLITGILLRTAGRPGWIRSFWVRRALRILPLCYGVLTFMVLPAWWVGLPLPFPPWVGYAFLTNFWLAYAPSPDIGLLVLWSLSVEEQFYAVWPWAVRWLGRRGLLVAVVAMLVLAPLLRVATATSFPSGAYHFTWCRMDALGWGALAAWLVHGRYDGVVLALRALAPVAVGAAAVALTLFSWDRTSPGFLALGYTLLSIASTAVVLRLATGPATGLARPLAWRPVRYVGEVSYGLYLLHAWVLAVLKGPLAGRMATAPWPLVLVGDLVAVAASVALAGLVYRVVEAPILAMKDRLAPNAPAPAAAARAA